MLEPWPFTGRSGQLEELGRVDRDGDRAGVVLYGPAGVGKSRLAEEALRSAERSGRRVERVVGHPATQEIPLGALAHLLPIDSMTSPGRGDDERTALFHGARAELRRLAGDGRLVLLVDDLDLLDDTSVAVLVPLIVARSVFLIGTVRAGRGGPDRFASLRRDGHLVRVEIGPLDEDDVGTLLHRTLDGPVSEAARVELARLSGGNLQVLHELVRGARERGILVHAGDRWDLVGPLPTTAGLEDLVAEHLAGVDAAGRELLEELAVCERFGLVDLEDVYGRRTLEDLEASGLVAVVRSQHRQAVRLSHPIYGEVLRSGMPRLRIRRIQSELADRIEAHGARRREDVVQVATWRVASGGAVAPERLVLAARLAIAGRDPALAVTLLTTGGADAVDPVDRAALLVEAHAMTGELAPLEAVVEAAWELSIPDGRRAQMAARLAETRFFAEGDLDGALAAHAQARARVHDREVAARIDARRANLLAGAGKPTDALRLTNDIDTIAMPATRVEMAAARSVGLINVGRFDEARELARTAGQEQAALADELDRRGAAQHVVNEAHALAYAGHYAEARALVAPAAERARATGATAAWIWFEMTLAEIARDTGRGHEALQRFSAVADAAPAAGQHAALVWAHVGVAQGHLLLGRCEAAAAALAAADAGESPVATSVATRERARAWLDACRGDLASARDRIRLAVEPVRQDEVYAFEVALLHDLARLGVPGEVVARLEVLAGQVDGPLVQIHLAHARALVHEDVDGLDRIVDRYEAIDALALAAEAAAQLADGWRARAEARKATAAAQRSADLAALAGDLRSPVLNRGEGVEPLTAREREVALLAAAGRSSREIAGHLHLSARTVDTHLARVYRKLGITGRADLAAALRGADS